VFTHIDGRFDTGLASREDGYLALNQDILPMFLVGTRAKGFREIHVKKVIVPLLATAHAMSI
jgi:hypothetical protein